MIAADVVVTIITVVEDITDVVVTIITVVEDTIDVVAITSVVAAAVIGGSNLKNHD